MSAEKIRSNRTESIGAAIAWHYPELRSLRVTPVARSSANVQYYLTDASNTVIYFVKDFLLQEEPHTFLSNEIEAVALLTKSVDLFLPECLAIADPEANLYLLLRQQVSGIPLSEVLHDPTAASSEIVAEAAGILAQIHSISAATWAHHLSGPADTHTTWEEYFTDHITHELTRASTRGLLNTRQIDFFQSKLAEIPLGENRVPTLVHGDFSSENILISRDKQRVMTVIDFELARFWLPSWDLTRIKQVGDFSNYFDHFMQTYTELTGNYPDILLAEIDYYAAFESLVFWNWAWARPSLRHAVDQSIKQTIPPV